MTPSRSSLPRLRFTGVVLLATILLLAWEHAHGGIRSHHFLGDPSFPAMHNGWGLLILPALAWFLSGSIARRGMTRTVLIGFVLAFAYGLALATAFSMGQMAITKALFFSLFAVAVILPVYRAECVLGFVFAMTFTFGPFIPIVFATIFAAISAAIHVDALPYLKRFIHTNRGTRSS